MIKNIYNIYIYILNNNFFNLYVHVPTLQSILFSPKERIIKNYFTNFIFYFFIFPMLRYQVTLKLGIRKKWEEHTSNEF